MPETALTKVHEGEGVIARLSNAFRALQKKAATKPPDLGPDNFSRLPYRFQGWGWNRNLSRVDHRQEVGDLDLNSLAMAVVNFTSIRIPEAKPAVVTTNNEGDEVKDFQHDMAKMVRRPNRHHIWANYVAACSMSWWFSGNVYFLKVRDVTGQVRELWFLPYFMVTPRFPNDKRSPEVPDDKNNDPFLSYYEYRIPGKEPVLYPASDVVHIKRGLDLNNPRLGLGAFEPLYKELYGDDKMALFTASIMANMGIQVPVISPKEKDISFGPEQAAAMKESWMAKTTGSRAGEPVIMTEQIDVEKFGFNPRELDTSSLRLIPESRVCAVCQISPAALQLMVGIQNGTSYASSEQARQQGYEEVIIPIQRAWEEEFTWQLLPEFKGSEGAEFVFDTTKVRVLQEDRDALFKRESEALRAGGQSINGYLQSIGKKPVGTDGDVYLVPSASSPMTLEKIATLAKNMTPPPEPVPIDPASLAKFAEMERMFEGLEEQMKGFQVT